jgi:hypothetical protein
MARELSQVTLRERAWPPIIDGAGSDGCPGLAIFAVNPGVVAWSFAMPDRADSPAYEGVAVALEGSCEQRAWHTEHTIHNLLQSLLPA